MNAAAPAVYYADADTPQALRAAWHALTAETKLPIRDAARRLGVAEAQLLATGIGEFVVRLSGDLRGLMLRMGELGPVQAVTRNAAAVHEKEGVYQNISHGDQIGLVQGDAIDLRLFYDQWAFGYAVEEQTGQATRRSFQFFNACGDAVHKIFLEPASDVLAFEALRDAWAAPIQIPGETVLPHPAGRKTGQPDEAIDLAALVADWRAMRDASQFFVLLKRHQLSRTQAYRLIGGEFAVPLFTRTPALLLQTAAAIGQPLMVYVGNPGCVQIHSGTVKTVQRNGDWLSVLDSGFNLHLREDQVAQAWLVKKPSAHGIVTSVELFDAAGDFIAYFFGKRLPGLPETTGWRVLAESLEPN